MSPNYPYAILIVTPHRRGVDRALPVRGFGGVPQLHLFFILVTPLPIAMGRGAGGEGSLCSTNAISYGPEVTRLAELREGRILAVLNSVIYLESYEGYVVAIVDYSAVDSPLSLRIRDFAPLRDALQKHQQSLFTSNATGIEMGRIAYISLCNAEPWHASLPSSVGAASQQESAIRALSTAIATHFANKTPGIPEEAGAAHLIALCREASYSPSSMESLAEHTPQLHPASLVLRRLAHAILRFVASIQSGNGTDAGAALTTVIGLGFGLTPSGDDLVMGILASLVWQSNLGLVDHALSAEVAEQALAVIDRTNSISKRLLWYASKGILYEPAMTLGAALLAGDTSGIDEPAQRLFTIGRTSGTDVAFGLLIGCLAGTTGRQNKDPLARASVRG